MSMSYARLLNDFTSGTDIMNAIVSNNASIYYYIAEIMIFGSDTYRNTENRAGRQVAEKLLLESLIILRRQLKYGKLALTIERDVIYTDRNKTELIHHLDQLLMLNYEIGHYNQVHNQSGDFERKLINGQGYHKILKLKGAIIRSLYSFGCKNDDDKEEIFNECLVVFWQKLICNQVGFYVSGKTDKPDNYHVYNKKFYQNSKLSTYLTGIAKNIFMNRIKSVKITEPVSADLPDKDMGNPEIHLSENPLIFMFLYYRVFVEPRKLRTVISILQYDCNLEDKEVRQLIGINNARIHSCRLRCNFHEWYSKNLNFSHVIFDKASGYLEDRESKTVKLNEKIRVISSYRESANLWKVDLGIFREEFRTNDDFKRFHQVFRYLVYLSYTGKSANLAGLPDEKLLRDMMGIYKNGLSLLPGYKSLIFLFYYGSEEPGNIIINLLNNLSNELAGLDQNPEAVRHLVSQLENNSPSDASDLTNKIYETNCTLFSHFSGEKDFLNMIKENESCQRTF
jgi:hypothetical protein